MACCLINSKNDIDKGHDLKLHGSKRHHFKLVSSSLWKDVKAGIQAETYDQELKQSTWSNFVYSLAVNGIFSMPGLPFQGVSSTRIAWSLSYKSLIKKCTTELSPTNLMEACSQFRFPLPRWLVSHLQQSKPQTIIMNKRWTKNITKYWRKK